MKLSVSRILQLSSVVSTAYAQGILYRNTTIATWNDTTQAVEVLRGASLLIEGDTITRISLSSEQVTGNNTEVIDAGDKIVVPGFINTHHHMWQTLYKTLLPNTPFAAYFPLLGHMAPISQTLTTDDVYRSELMGALEQMSEGTTSWVDVTGVLSPSTVDAAVRASLASGGRSFFGAMLQPKPTFSEEDQIAQIRDLASRDEVRNQSLVSIGLSYDGFDGATQQSRERVLDLIQTTDFSFITTHYPVVAAKWNATYHLQSQFYLTPRDANLLRENDQYISTAPESEQHFGQGNPFAHRIQDQTSLSVDTPLSYSTSMVTQARMWLQQLRGRLQQQQIDNWIINTNIPMTVDQSFYLATRAGALSLRRTDLGIIAEGAKADLVVFDTNDLNLFGWWDPVAAVMLHSNSGNICDVLVDGKFVKRDFNMTFEDFATLRADFQRSAQAFQQTFSTYDFPTEVPEYFTLGTYGEALEVDVVRSNATG